MFLLLLCNDKDVLGPWVNSRLVNYFADAVVAVPVMMSIILTASILFSEMTDVSILWIIVTGMIAAILLVIGVKRYEQSRRISKVASRPHRGGRRQ